MPSNYTQEDCFNAKPHTPHVWTYNAAGSSAQFKCKGVK